MSIAVTCVHSLHVPEALRRRYFLLILPPECDDAFALMKTRLTLRLGEPLGEASESVWAMYLLLRLKLNLAEEAQGSVDTCEDSLAALMGLALKERGFARPDSLTSLNVFAEPEELTGRQWLLCYEGTMRDWIKAPSHQEPGN